MTYGAFVHRAQVEKAVNDTLQKWFPDYLAEFRRQNNLSVAQLIEPRSYAVHTRFDNLVDDHLPAVVVISPGLDNGIKPYKSGSGLYTCSWSIGVGIIVSGNDWEDTAYRVGAYTSCIRAILVQQSSLDGLAEQVSWRDESYDDHEDEDGRTLSAGVVSVGVIISRVVDDTAGPLVPGNTETSWPATDVDMTIVRRPLTGNL